MFFFGTNAPTLQSRELLQRPGPVPDSRLAKVILSRAMPLLARSPSTTTSSSSSQQTCADNETTGRCERMVAATPNVTTIPVVLGVVIPLSVAFVVLVILHRRHVKKLRREDAEDKHKSLDFGMDGAAIVEKNKKGKKGKKFPEMSAADARNSVRQDRGLSMDLSMANPYLLPPEMQQSRESLHSLSRTINTGDDKYRATNFIPDDGSLRSPSSLHHNDSASIYTYSSRHRAESESTKGLIPNGHGLNNGTVPIIQVPTPAARPNNTSLLTPATHEASRESCISTTSSNGNITAMRASNNYLGQYISGGAKKKVTEDEEAEETVAEVDNRSTHHEADQTQSAVPEERSTKQDNVPLAAADFDFGIPPNTYELSSNHEPTLPRIEIPHSDKLTSEIYEAPGHEIPTHDISQPSATNDLEIHQEPQTTSANNPHGPPDINVIADYDNESDYYDDEGENTYDIDDYKETLGYDPRRLTMGMRPLPPDDPSENPEERAIRIRSFYKEYFDDTAKPGGEKARLSYFDGSENYIDDYYGSHHQPSYGYGSYGHSSYGYAPQPYGSRGPSAMSTRAPAGRHRATVSNGSFLSGGPGPRAYSSASQRLPVQRTRAPPKKNLPPPAPLPILPSPSMLKEDSMLPNAVDFAPPQVFKNQRSGTPDSLKGGLRPYSPSARAYNPLVSSFDDLSALPSPHQLRKSGTFTSLDFAPPRFAAAPSTGSDAGSIRSNKSGMSAMQLHNIRSGAYRLSRIPKEVAGTREELANALKPQWKHAR